MARTGRPRIHPRPTGDTLHFLGVRVPAEQVARLDEVVAAEGTARSALLREALELLFANRAHQTEPVDEEAAA